MYDAPRDLSADLLKTVMADRASHWTNPKRCDDLQVIRRYDDAKDRATSWRGPYLRDAEKILNTPAYNRYAGKTQVFSFRKNDDISRRGLHVQLVSRIARDIGSTLGLNVDLIEAIALGHDLGHTPFGHTGERCLNAVFNRRTGRWFRHNLQSVRVLDALYSRNVSLQTLDGIMCHNGEYEQRVFRVSDTRTFDDFDRAFEACVSGGDPAIGRLAPMTLEGCVVRLSDIIAYVGKDRQDAELAGIYGRDADNGGIVGGRYNAWVQQAIVVDVIENSYGKDLVQMSQKAFDELSQAKKDNYRTIYHCEEVEGDCGGTIAPMFEMLYQKTLEDLASGDETRPVFRFHIEPLTVQTSYYGRSYDWESDPDQTVADFLSSMTDDFFTALYQEQFPDYPIKNPYRGYFD